jgi:hypothetical protein
VRALGATGIVVLATAAAARSSPPGRHTPTPVERTVELMEALKHHHYAAACEVYDPLFWTMVGYPTHDCAKVLAKTFPRREAVAYRVHFGGRITSGMAVVIASMALGDTARFCGKVWQAGRQCSRGSTYHFGLTMQTLLVDWRGRKVAAPQSRWYVSSIGGV